jgi:hypothetical protein
VLSVTPEDFDICLTKVAPYLHEDNLSFVQAIQQPGRQAAMNDEISSISKNQTWDLVPLPLGKKAISAK